MIKTVCILLLMFANINIFGQSSEDRAKAAYFTAQEEFDNGNYQNCIANLDKAKSYLNVTNVRIQYLMVKSYYQLNNYQQAKLELIKYFDLKPKEDDWYKEMLKLIDIVDAKIAEQIELEKKKAKEQAELEEKEKKKESDIYITRGFAFYRLQNYKSAINDFNKAIEIYPYDVTSFYMLGYSYIMEDKYLLSMDNFKRGLSIDLKDFDINIGIAVSYYYQNDKTNSLIFLKNAINIMPILKEGLNGYEKLKKDQDYSYPEKIDSVIKKMLLELY